LVTALFCRASTPPQVQAATICRIKQWHVKRAVHSNLCIKDCGGKRWE
jgi:hypothetical protein